jgi:sulfate adenylyltransferase subunit 1
MDILKFITAGSVDDGKSTLIGRLLYDTDSILEDQLEAIRNANRKNDDGTVDLAILTDGLKAEREQGITIDVAYKYFQTDKRKFIIADTPGHIQYTRNMVTGASGADLAIILIDARKGVIEQTIRHSFLVSLLNLQHVLVCVNKMDMVDYDHQAFEKIKSDYLKIAAKLTTPTIDFIPVSALRGDNIVHPSRNMHWYSGPSLLEYLETVDVKVKTPGEKGRFPVQWIVRPQTDELHDYRGYAGRVGGGVFRPGDKVVVLPSGFRSTITHIELNNEQLAEAPEGASVILRLKDDIDISRGDLIVSADHVPELRKDVSAAICWMDTRPLDLSQTYLLQCNSKISRVKVRDILSKININTLEEHPADSFGLNDIGKVQIRSADELAADPYLENKTTGGAILIDSRTNLTVGALMFD